MTDGSANLLALPRGYEIENLKVIE